LQVATRQTHPGDSKGRPAVQCKGGGGRNAAYGSGGREDVIARFRAIIKNLRHTRAADPRPRGRRQDKYNRPRNAQSARRGDSTPPFACPLQAGRPGIEPGPRYCKIRFVRPRFRDAYFSPPPRGAWPTCKAGRRPRGRRPVVFDTRHRDAAAREQTARVRSGDVSHARCKPRNFGLQYDAPALSGCSARSNARYTTFAPAAVASATRATPVPCAARARSR